MKKTCTRCRWHNNKYVNCAPFFGNKSADVLFCGEAFGAQEAINYKEEKGYEQLGAFVGKAGIKFDELLEIINFDRSDIAVMNSLRCYQSGNPTPSKRELDLCFIHSHKDIQTIDPKLVIAMVGLLFIS